MAEVLGDVLGAAVANGSNSGGGQGRAAEVIGPRGNFWVPNRVGFLGSKSLIRLLYAVSIRPIYALS